MSRTHSRPRPSRLVKGTAVAGLTVAATLSFTAPVAAISNGRDDADNARANAVVRVVADGVSCTGTLITADIVATAAHCIGAARGNPPHDPAQRLPGCPGDWQVSGRWYPLQGTATVFFGRDLANTTPVSATQYSLPVCADLMLLRLANPVPRTTAVPIPVLANFGDNWGTTDASKLEGEAFEIVGWGLDATGSIARKRQKATARYRSHTGSKLLVNVVAPATTQPGDSGSPLLWTSPSGIRYVIGVMQGAGSISSYTPTFRGPLDGGVPAVSAFFVKAAPRALECPRLYSRSATVQLGSWWSRGRADNFITASRSFIGCHSAIRSPDYGYYRTEGYAFDPNRPQRAGTVPLYRWYDPYAGDNRATTAYPVTGAAGRNLGTYRFSGLDGYVYDPRRAQPSFTRPLYTWYSPSRDDYWTTTQYAAAGAARQGLSPDYTFIRLEGYAPIW